MGLIEATILECDSCSCICRFLLQIIYIIYSLMIHFVCFIYICFFAHTNNEIILDFSTFALSSTKRDRTTLHGEFNGLMDDDM